eukprot:246747-Pyramimonas_sp.AAC.1
MSMNARRWELGSSDPRMRGVDAEHAGLLALAAAPMSRSRTFKMMLAFCEAARVIDARGSRPSTNARQ